MCNLFYSMRGNKFVSIAQCDNLGISRINQMKVKAKVNFIFRSEITKTFTHTGE